jgi:hypothetical protein
MTAWPITNIDFFRYPYRVESTRRTSQLKYQKARNFGAHHDQDLQATGNRQQATGNRWRRKAPGPSKMGFLRRTLVAPIGARILRILSQARARRNLELELESRS